MEGAILSTASNNRLRTHLKNAASALCARTLPKQRRTDLVSTSARHHHTYPRSTPPKRAAIACRMEPLICDTVQQPTTLEQPQTIQYDVMEVQPPSRPNGTIKLKGTLAKEVANAWGCRVGPPDQPAPAKCVQSLFNDIELYPTKTQGETDDLNVLPRSPPVVNSPSRRGQTSRVLFEMLVCARQCARRKSLTLTFGEFCVFAAELRRCSRQARQTPNKPESPLWNVDKELKDKDANKHVNGSEASPPPPYEVFLGGSCNPTTWRTDIAIPMLKKMGITYFNPQVDDWSMELVEVEHRAKAAARALLFVLDSETRAVAASVEAAQLAAEPKDLLLVLKPYSRHQTIGQEKITEHEYVELSRARATLQEVVERRGLPAFTDIPNALRCARMVLRGARTHPQHLLGYTIRRLKRAFDACGGRNGQLPRPKAVDALRDVTKSTREAADSCLPSVDCVDFETFCAAVAELAADPGRASSGGGSSSGVAAAVRRVFRSLRDRLTPAPEVQDRNGTESEGCADAGAGVRDATDRVTDTARETNGLHVCNARLKAYGRKLGLFIPKNGGNRPGIDTDSGAAASDSSGDAVFTPGTERRLERLPAMLGAPTHDVYLGGTFPSNNTRPEDILRRENLTYVIPRPNDYTRMFSAPARRSAPAHPESPRHDKKPRPSPLATPTDEVQLRDRSVVVEPTERLSASDFYTVPEDSTPQPFKGMYDEDLLLGSRVLVFSMSAESPCFATMVLAAHYMGLRPSNVVLLVQTMDPAKAHNYSECALKDYNRGRHYLTDLARRSGIPVFDNVDSTINHVVNRLKT